MFKVGWGKKCISPTENVSLGGYRHVRKSVGVHDDIYVKTLLIENSTQSIVFVIYDLVAVGKRFISELKKELTKHCDNHTEFIVSATHTHSAPTGTIKTSNGLFDGLDDVFGKWDEVYVDFLFERTVSAVKDMYAKNTDVRFKGVESEVDNVTSNRNHESNSADKRLLAMEFSNANDERIVLWHYSCHPTVLNQTNQFISQDFPGAVERDLTEYDWVGYLNGAAGDLSTRFTRKTSSFTQVDEFGRKIANVMRDALEGAEPSSEDSLCVKTSEVHLKTITHPDSSETTIVPEYKNLDTFTNDQQLLGLQTYYKLRNNLVNQPFIKLSISILQINGFNFFTFPGEVYFSLLENSLQEFGIRIIGYANGYNLYLTDSIAFEENNYEALSSPFMKGEGERFIKIIENLL